MLQDGLHRKFITCYDAIKKALRVTIGDGVNEADILAANGSHGLVVIEPNHVSSINSTNDVLGIGEVFQGVAENITNYAILFVNVYSNVASATKGLCMEHSSDGVNWYLSECYTIEANKYKTFSHQCASKYYRIKYTNGSVAQTTFDLEVKMCTKNALDSSHRIDDVISGQDDARLVKAVLTAKNLATDLFVPINTSKSGNLQITDAESSLAIAKDEVLNHLPISRFSNAKDFDATDIQVTVWDGADDGAAWELMNYVYSTIADIDSISSSDAADTLEITIVGQTLDGTEVTQTKTLQGQTRVALDTPLRRIYLAYNNNGVNLIGHVIIYVNTPIGGVTAGVPTDKTKIRAIIDPTNQQTLMSVYTIPKGYTGYLRRGYASTSGANKTSNYIITFLTRKFGKVFRTQNINSISDSGSSFIILDYDVPLKMEELTDLEVKAQMTAVGGTGASISAGFDIILVQN